MGFDVAATMMNMMNQAMTIQSGSMMKKKCV